MDNDRENKQEMLDLLQEKYDKFYIEVIMKRIKDFLNKYGLKQLRIIFYKIKNIFKKKPIDLIKKVHNLYYDNDLNKLVLPESYLETDEFSCWQQQQKRKGLNIKYSVFIIKDSLKIHSEYKHIQKIFNSILEKLNPYIMSGLNIYNRTDYIISYIKDEYPDDQDKRLQLFDEIMRYYEIIMKPKQEQDVIDVYELAFKWIKDYL